MSNSIERPLFFEGQILSADDLTTAVDFSRNQLAQHERYLHLWGIAGGLGLSGKEKQTAQGQKFQEVTVAAGVAIDGRGREIVVPADEVLSPENFDELSIATADPDGTALYPVFLVGRDITASQTAMVARACDNSQPSRSVEGFDITFGSPGEEANLDDQLTVALTDGPGDSSNDKDWRILLGYVGWGATLSDGTKKVKNFIKVVNTSKEGVGPRYAGVQADVVAARSGSLSLRTSAGSQADKPAVLLEDTAKGGLLRFGSQNAAGVLTEVFSIDSKGNVVAKGSLSGAVTPSTIKVQSGVITDGAVLPLPPGISEQQVTDGVTLHIHLTPRPFAAAKPPVAGNDWIAVPLECALDATSRRVLCRSRWFQLGTPTTFYDVPGTCDYTVLASVPPTKTGS